jgi:nitrate/nitrite transporter NarK
VADRTLHRLAALYAASYGLSVILGNWVVELLQHHSSFSDEGAAAVGSLTLLLGVVTRPLGGWLLRARRREARQLLSLSLAAGGVGTVALAASGPAWLAVVGGTLVGVGAGMPFSAAFTGAARARPDAPAAAVAFVNATANLVVLVGTPLVGLSFSLSGEGRAGFLVIAALWVAAIAVLPGPQAFILTSRTP